MSGGRPTPPPEDATVLAAVRGLLAEAHTAGVATVADDGTPWAVNLYFAALPEPGLRLVVLSDSSSAHVRHWRMRPRIALSVYGQPDTPRHAVRGVQMRGRVEETADPTARAAYLARFPDATDALATQAAFLVEIDWVRWLERRSGTLAELVLPVGPHPSDPPPARPTG